jgi:hypothetical protein
MAGAAPSLSYFRTSQWLAGSPVCGVARVGLAMAVRANLSE